MAITKKAKREAILYVRITKKNKQKIEKEANRLGYTLSEYINELLTNYLLAPNN